MSSFVGNVTDIEEEILSGLASQSELGFVRGEWNFRAVGHESDGEILYTAEKVGNSSKTVHTIIFSYNPFTKVGRSILKLPPSPARVINATLGPQDHKPLLFTMGQAAEAKVRPGVDPTTFPPILTHAVYAFCDRLPGPKCISSQLKLGERGAPGRGFVYMLKASGGETAEFIHVTATSVTAGKVSFKGGKVKVARDKENLAKGRTVVWHSYDPDIRTLATVNIRGGRTSVTVFPFRRPTRSALIDGAVTFVSPIATAIARVAKDRGLTQSLLPMVGAPLTTCSSLLEIPATFGMTFVSSNGMVLSVSHGQTDLHAAHTPFVTHYVLHQNMGAIWTQTDLSNRLASTPAVVRSLSTTRTPTALADKHRRQMAASLQHSASVAFCGGVLTVGPALGAALRDVHPAHSTRYSRPMLAAALAPPPGVTGAAFSTSIETLPGVPPPSVTHLSEGLDAAEVLEAVFPATPLRYSAVLVRSREAAADLSSPTFTNSTDPTRPYQKLALVDHWAGRAIDIDIDPRAIAAAPDATGPAFEASIHLLATHLHALPETLGLIAAASQLPGLTHSSVRVALDEVTTVLSARAVATSTDANKRHAMLLLHALATTRVVTGRHIRHAGLRSFGLGLAPELDLVLWVSCHPMPPHPDGPVIDARPAPAPVEVDARTPMSPRPRPRPITRERVDGRASLTNLLMDRLRFKPGAKSRPLWLDMVSDFAPFYQRNRSAAVVAIVQAVIRSTPPTRLLDTLIALRQTLDELRAPRCDTLTDAVALVALQTLPEREFLQFVQRDVVTLTSLSLLWERGKLPLARLPGRLAYYIVSRASSDSRFRRGIQVMLTGDGAEVHDTAARRTMLALLEYNFVMEKQPLPPVEYREAFDKACDDWAALPPESAAQDAIIPNPDAPPPRTANLPLELFVHHVKAAEKGRQMAKNLDRYREIIDKIG